VWFFFWQCILWNLWRCGEENPHPSLSPVQLQYPGEPRVISASVCVQLVGGMAAPSRRYRKCSKTMSLVALLLGLSVALAAGNDAISAPKAGKDLQQRRQPDIEDDGGARPEKDFDFAAYVNGECLGF